MNTKMPAEALGFTQYLQSKKHSNNTQKRYTDSVNDFLKWFKKDPINARKKDVLGYLSYLKKKRNQSNSSRKGHLTGLKHYFTFLQDADLMASNPTNFINIRGARKKILYNIYSFTELEELNDNFYHYYINNVGYNKYVSQHDRKRSQLCRQRNYTMLGVLLFQGIATTELKTITLDNLDLNKATLTIKGRKRSNGRTLPLNAAQMGTLINYTQQIRPQLVALYGKESDQLFLSQPLSGQQKSHDDAMRGMLQYLMAQVKHIDPKFVNFKQIRASLITHWIKNEGLRKAQYLAGHRYISSTESYKVNDLESLTDDIAKHHPF